MLSLRIHPFHLRRLIENAPLPYEPFTTAYDEIVNATDIVDNEELRNLRSRLDDERRRVYSPLASKRLGDELYQTLSVAYTDPKDTVVTLLLDTSGSMRGIKITTIAILADLLATKLETLGVRTEILSHTTRTWKGGRAREDWLEAGKPPSPGRLAELRLVIYKDAFTSRQRARNNFGLLLREGLLKENIDGEALQWAERRLLNIPAQRRIMICVGDLLPVDDSTLSVNPREILNDHFKAVAKNISRHRKIELCAISLWNELPTGFARVERLGHTPEDLAQLPTPDFSRRVARLFAQATP